MGGIRTKALARIGTACRSEHYWQACSGLDLLAVQDHPYQPHHLETWTYLTHLAANTTHISLMPNVADLALRPPTMLAKAATSLDVLTDGRVELPSAPAASPTPSPPSEAPNEHPAKPSRQPPKHSR